MKSSKSEAGTPRLFLKAATAQDIMSSNPLSIDENATVMEAVAMLLDKGISAAPVINDAGHPIGMLSRTDLLRHQRESTEYLRPEDKVFHKPELDIATGEHLGKGFQVIAGDKTRIRDIMTPTVFTVTPEMPIELAIKEMLAHKVHHLCVVDRFGVLVGIISPLDILRDLVSPSVHASAGV
jgi:CBS domain-containing protein